MNPDSLLPDLVFLLFLQKDTRLNNILCIQENIIKRKAEPILPRITLESKGF
jgi:hypothetical protein